RILPTLSEVADRYRRSPQCNGKTHLLISIWGPAPPRRPNRTPFASAVAPTDSTSRLVHHELCLIIALAAIKKLSVRSPPLLQGSPVPSDLAPPTWLLKAKEDLGPMLFCFAGSRLT